MSWPRDRRLGGRVRGDVSGWVTLRAVPRRGPCRHVVLGEQRHRPPRISVAGRVVVPRRRGITGGADAEKNTSGLGGCSGGTTDGSYRPPGAYGRCRPPRCRPVEAFGRAAPGVGARTPSPGSVVMVVGVAVLGRLCWSSALLSSGAGHGCTASITGLHNSTATRGRRRNWLIRWCDRSAQLTHPPDCSEPSCAEALAVRDTSWAGHKRTADRIDPTKLAFEGTKSREIAVRCLSCRWPESWTYCSPSQPSLLRGPQGVELRPDHGVEDVRGGAPAIEHLQDVFRSTEHASSGSTD